MYHLHLISRSNSFWISKEVIHSSFATLDIIFCQSHSYFEENCFKNYYFHCPFKKTFSKKWHLISSTLFLARCISISNVHSDIRETFKSVIITERFVGPILYDFKILWFFFFLKFFPIKLYFILFLKWNVNFWRLPQTSKMESFTAIVNG